MGWENARRIWLSTMCVGLPSNLFVVIIGLTSCTVALDESLHCSYKFLCSVSVLLWLRILLKFFFFNASELMSFLVCLDLIICFQMQHFIMYITNYKEFKTFLCALRSICFYTSGYSWNGLTAYSFIEELFSVTFLFSLRGTVLSVSSPSPFPSFRIAQSHYITDFHLGLACFICAQVICICSSSVQLADSTIHGSVRR